MIELYLLQVVVGAPQLYYQYLLVNDKMKTVVILAITVITHGGVVDEKQEPKCITVNGIYHDIEVLKTDLDRPYSLAVDYSTNIVYFSYGVNKEDDVFKTGYINLNTNEFGDLEGVNGFTQAIDQKNHEIYIGGNDGIYKYNHVTKLAEFYAEKGIDLWNIYFKDVLFYSTFPMQFFYTYVNGESLKFKDLQDTKVDQFVIDNEDIMFYTNATGLFGQKKGTGDAKLYQKFPTDGIRGLTTDKNSSVYFSRADGIYSVDKASVSVVKIADLDDVYGLAFDNDNNIIYSDGGKMIRLKPNKDKSC